MIKNKNQIYHNIGKAFKNKSLKFQEKLKNYQSSLQLYPKLDKSLILYSKKIVFSTTRKSKLNFPKKKNQNLNPLKKP